MKSVVLALTLAVPVFGAVIQATNAGPLPASAQDLTSVYPSEIDGTLAFPNGVNMFKLSVPFPLSFSALTSGLPFGVPDTELFLFNSSGLGVYANDDITASNTLSCLPAATGNPCPSGRSGLGPVNPGVYYLAITRSANSPLSSGGNIFTFASSNAVAGPDLTKGGGSPIIGWDNAVNTGPDFDLAKYKITLSGTVPEPATWFLVVVGFGILLIKRRRRTAINYVRWGVDWSVSKPPLRSGTGFPPFRRPPSAPAILFQIVKRSGIHDTSIGSHQATRRVVQKSLIGE